MEKTQNDDDAMDELSAHLDRAWDLLEKEYLDALLLKAEAQLELGDDQGARETLQDLPPGSLPEAQLEYRAGRSLLDAGELPAAERRLHAALEMDPKLTDALHALGLLHE